MNETVKRLASIIRTVEALGHCHICFHDFFRHILEYVPDVPVYHQNDFCICLKNLFPEQKPTCIKFDRNAVVRHLEGKREPFFKQCPHHVLELVVPIYKDNVLCGILFMGPYRAGAPLSEDGLRGTPPRLNDKIRREIRPAFEKLPVLDQEGMTHIRNLGIMLASRIAETLAGMEIPPDAEEPGRRRRIEHFIARNFNQGATLDILADSLGLSTSRTSRLLKEYFNAGFSELLNQHRLGAAIHFLQRSELAINEVARRAGFDNIEYFHRIFKKHYGITPLEYRRKFLQGKH